MDKREKVKELKAMGYSYREISKILSLPLTTVYRYAKEEGKKARKRGGKLLLYVQKLQEDPELRSRLVDLLLFTTDEKGRKRTIPYAKIYRELELFLRASGIDISYHRFLQVLKAFIACEFGGIEELEKLRRPKEAHLYRVPKGRVLRPQGLLELDATGYTFDGVQYSLLFGFDPASGFLIKPLIVANKETGATHYNKAFSSFDVAEYLIELFKTYGIPQAIRCDNERILKSQLIKEGLEKLGVKLQTTKPYNPNHKLIERAFKTFKEELRIRQALSKGNSFTEIVDLAVDQYNHSQHSFIHAQLIPADVFAGYPNKLPDSVIENAFTVTEERTLRDNLIKLDGRTYTMLSPVPKKKVKVLVKASLKQLQEIDVYDAETGEFIGVARLTGETISETPGQVKEKKQLETRLKRREKKLQQELAEIKREQSPIELEDLDSISLEEIPVEPQKEQASQSDDWLTLEDL